MIKFDIQNELGCSINTNMIEYQEQILANTYINETDTVLELGARYGSVSCVINSKLKNKLNHLAVEPDSRVWSALMRNRDVNGCKFNILNGFVSNLPLDLTNINYYHGGYGATAIANEFSKIPHYTLNEVQTMYNLNFNVLVADCEGFLETFFEENPTFYDKLRLVIFEADYPEKCDYAKIKSTLHSKKFDKILEGHQNVWIKK
jgi:FkbM family methyltransferase